MEAKTIDNKQIAIAVELTTCARCGATESPRFFSQQGNVICGDCYYYLLETFPNDFSLAGE